MDPLGDLVREGGLQLFSQGVQSEVEGLLMPGQALEPEARERLVQAIQTGTRHQPGQEPLESLLFRTRRESQTNIVEVARRAEVEPSLVADLERGTVALRDQKPNTIVSWIKALNVKELDAVASLRKSFAISHSGVYASAEGSQGLTEDDERFVQVVQRLLKDGS
jgi:cell division FtsZ-interacting protein ZapD